VTDKKYEPVNLIPWIILFGLLLMLAMGDGDAGIL